MSTHHSNGAKAAVNGNPDSSPEFHEREPRGVWIPIDIWNMAKEGRMSFTELRLHIEIDSLVRSKGQGCYATNAYLAREVGIDPRHVQRIKNRWKNKTLFVTGKITYRGKTCPVWETVWSRASGRSVNTFTDDRDVTPRGDEDVTQLMSSKEDIQKTATCGSAAPPPHPRHVADGGRNRLLRLGNGHSPTLVNNGSPSVNKYPPITRRAAPVNTCSLRRTEMTNNSERPPKVESVVLPFQDPPPVKVTHSLVVARKLRLLASSRNVRVYGKLKTWQKEVESLIRWTFKGDELRARDAINAYVQFVDDGKMQPVISSKGIKRAVLWAEQRKEKLAGKSIPWEKMTPAAQGIVQRLSELHWPKGSATQLPWCVEMSLHSYQILEQSLADSPPEFSDRKDLVRFASHLKDVLPSRTDFVEQWFRDVNRKLLRWTNWSGDLSIFQVYMYNPDFSKIARGWAADWCGDPSLWDRLLEVL